jgi:hypothetical protein
MSGDIPPLPQYAFMAWCSVKAQGQLYLFTITLYPCSEEPATGLYPEPEEIYMLKGILLGKSVK